MPFLAFLPTLLGIFSAAPKVFEAGKAIVAEVTGQPVPEAVTPKELIEQIKTLPPEQAQAIVDAARANIDMVKAENERLKIEGGEMTAELLVAIPEKKRAEIAVLRVTTRPWMARYAMRVIAAPIIVAAGDYSLMWLNGIYRVFTQQRDFVPFDLFAEKIMAPDSAYVTAYLMAAPTCVTIVLAFISVRELQKTGHPAEGLAGKVTGAIDAVKGLLRRK